jgi:hypothetical protein
MGFPLCLIRLAFVMLHVDVITGLPAGAALTEIDLDGCRLAPATGQEKA